MRRDVSTQASNQVIIQAQPWRDWAAGQVFQEAPFAPKMVVVPAGEFWMGADPGEPGSVACESPRHRVRIASPFAMGETTVTRSRFACFVDAHASNRTEPNDWDRRSQLPMVNVSWHDAQAYTQWLSEQLGAVYALPTEAQWEYACRAGTETAFFTGNTIAPMQANFSKQLHPANSPLAGHPVGYVEVGQYSANAFGLHDMHGNVLEWVQDGWHASYAGAPDTGDAPWAGADTRFEDDRVLRGGGWHASSQHLRSAARGYEDAGLCCYHTIGFRVMRVLA